MTKLTFDIISNFTNKAILTDVKTYPEAKAQASAIGNCTIKSVYTECEIKDETRAKHRLIAIA